MGQAEQYVGGISPQVIKAAERYVKVVTIKRRKTRQLRLSPAFVFGETFPLKLEGTVYYHFADVWREGSEPVEVWIDPELHLSPEYALRAVWWEAAKGLIQNDNWR